MKCPRCQQENPASLKFCGECKREKAQEQLACARTMYREMDMRFWLEQAEAERP